MSAHTAGPWQAQLPTCADAHMCRVTTAWLKDGCYLQIADASVNGSYVGLTGIERAANARLIAAAPELYQALRDTVSAAGGIHSDHVPESARLALAKAEALV